MIEFEYILGSEALTVSADDNGLEITQMSVYGQDGEEVTLSPELMEEIHELARLQLEDKEEHGLCFGCAYC